MPDHRQYSFLLFSSLYWVSQVSTIIAVIVSNGNRVVVPGFDKNTVWNLLTNYKVSNYKNK